MQSINDIILELAQTDSNYIPAGEFSTSETVNVTAEPFPTLAIVIIAIIVSLFVGKHFARKAGR